MSSNVNLNNLNQNNNNNRTPTNSHFNNYTTAENFPNKKLFFENLHKVKYFLKQF